MTRKFNEQEVALILQRATEVRGEGTPALYEAGGLSLAEVKEIAAEAGIDPVRVEQAAQSLVLPPRTKSHFEVVLGTPADPQFVSEFEVALGDEDFSDLVGEIRSVMARQGIVGGRPGSLEWMARDSLGGRYVTISQTTQGTRVQVLGNFRDAGVGATAIAIVTAVLGTAGVAAAVGAAGSVGWLALPVVAAGAIAIPRFTIGRMIRTESRRLASLAGRLGTLIAARTRTLEGGENE